MNVSIKTKIAGISIQLVGLATIAIITTIVVQSRTLKQKMEAQIRANAVAEAGKIVQNIYLDCESAEGRHQKLLTHDLEIARETLGRLGTVSLDTNQVAWTAINQATKEKIPLQLPRMQAGHDWLGQNFAPDQPSLIVDEVRHLTQAHCTLFQRINDSGDMLRVDTSVLTTEGKRAIGTFIPSRTAEGTPNPVIETVLKGQTFRGRAFVVSEYHTAAYEPIWDAAKTRVIGMLYVGISMTDINRDIHDSMMKIVVGKTGYVYVIGGKGDSRGKYLVSSQGKRDGESIWEAKDANGRLVIQSIVNQALAAAPGTISEEHYFWKNTTEATAQKKFAAFTYFAPWDWVIGAGAYESDYHAGIEQVTQSVSKMIWWVAVVALIVGLAGLIGSFLMASGIVRSISHVIEQVWSGSNQVSSAASQVSSSSQSLADGASQQAASIEQTSASLEEMSSLIQRNAENAKSANELSGQARTAAEKCATDMQAMSQAMGAIQDSSTSIAKIIKVIDEIAFQTNILALNAAVEAARAGEAGMGFAVVADEVRNLAQRSAQAAKETAEKIEDAITKTSQGVELNQKVAVTLQEIVTKSRQVDELSAEVATASREQTQGITQINIAVGQVDQVTQANSASSEECAAAAEQLNAQAEMMKDSVQELLILIGQQAKQPAAQPNPAPPASTPRKPAQKKPHTVLN